MAYLIDGTATRQDRDRLARKAAEFEADARRHAKRRRQVVLNKVDAGMRGVDASILNGEGPVEVLSGWLRCLVVREQLTAEVQKAAAIAYERAAPSRGSAWARASALGCGEYDGDRVLAAIKGVRSDSLMLRNHGQRDLDVMGISESDVARLFPDDFGQAPAAPEPHYFGTAN